MNKAQTLREHLLASPLKLKASDVLLSMADCKVVSHVGSAIDNQHFQMEYVADLLLLSFSGQADVLTFVLLQWLDKAQPFRDGETFAMDADVLDSKKADIHIRIPLTETVKVRVLANGVELLHVDDPSADPEFLDAAVWRTFIGGEQVAQWP